MSIYLGNQQVGVAFPNDVEPIGLEEIGMHTFASGDVVYTGVRLWPYAFHRMTNITSFSAPNLVAFTDQASEATAGVGSYVFFGCSNLKTISLPNLVRTGSGGYQFGSCTSLEKVFLPKCFVGANMFRGCTKLKSAVVLSSSAMNGSGFYGCSLLESIDIKTSAIKASEFYNCAKLDKLVLRNTSMASLANVNAFTNTPFASGNAGGTLYVPESLISTYQTGSNWVTIFGYGNGEQNSIKSIESTHTDPTAPIDLTLYYADGTAIS